LKLNFRFLSFDIILKLKIQLFERTLKWFIFLDVYLINQYRPGLTFAELALYLFISEFFFLPEIFITYKIIY